MIELLEFRRLLAANPVNVNGTGAKDVIEINVGIDSYLVKVNGQQSDYPAVNVSTFIIACGDGDDIVVIGPGVALGCYADGGNGNDKMVGGDGPDTFLGAAGKDQLYGGGNNDRLNGAGGNDKVLGEAGADRVYGGDGNDYVDGGSSGDRLYLGNGADTALGQGGDDFIFAIDASGDHLFGGSGKDIGYINAADTYGSIEQIATV